MPKHRNDGISNSNECNTRNFFFFYIYKVHTLVNIYRKCKENVQGASKIIYTKKKEIIKAQEGLNKA